jgi:multimeric flavodoxin WrbA
MNILGISCSPRKGGNTDILVQTALEQVKELGAQTDFFSVSDKTINFCDACQACFKDKVCRIDDDMQILYSKFNEIDGLIFGTPVYFLNVSAQAKAIIDRTYAIRGKLKGKVAGLIVVTRRVGAGQVLSLLNSYFTFQRMIIAGAGIGYGLNKGDVRQGPGGAPESSALKEAAGVGKNVFNMIKRLNKDI